MFPCPDIKHLETNRTWTIQPNFPLRFICFYFLCWMSAYNNYSSIHISSTNVTDCECFLTIEHNILLTGFQQQGCDPTADCINMQKSLTWNTDKFQTDLVSCLEDQADYTFLNKFQKNKVKCKGFERSAWRPYPSVPEQQEQEHNFEVSVNYVRAFERQQKRQGEIHRQEMLLTKTGYPYQHSAAFPAFLWVWQTTRVCDTGADREPRCGWQKQRGSFWFCIRH